jgi:hypothetical protein
MVSGRIERRWVGSESEVKVGELVTYVEILYIEPQQEY